MENLEKTELGTKVIRHVLNKNGFQLEEHKYPNLIFIGKLKIQIVCPDRTNPYWLPVNANKDLSDIYVGFIFNGSKLTIEGYTYRHKLKHFAEDPDSGWYNPTYRAEIDDLEDIQSFLGVLKACTGKYV